MYNRPVNDACHINLLIMHVKGASFMLFILFIFYVDEHYRLINYLNYLIYNYNIMI